MTGKNCVRESIGRVAEQGLEKCKDDLTDIFIHLLVEAKKDKDEDRGTTHDYI